MHRIRKSNILIIGDWNQLTQEICKNLVLNGIDTLSLLILASYSDAEATMFGSIDNAKHALKDINPRVKLLVHSPSVEVQALSNSRHIIFTSKDSETVFKYYNLLRAQEKTFSWILVNDEKLYLINDFQSHTYHLSL